ncbi:MAG: hypothetical protein IJI46_08075 [Erysipelotrichaceae bacterium]|nr:hypothetical protein [Erysipelotrichaceae bacterium]
MSNRLRLTLEEDKLIKERYPDIDMDNLLLPVEGMATITNLDMLVSDISFDIENKKLPQEELVLGKGIKEKAEFFKKHQGKNYVPGFDFDRYCQRADEVALKALGEPIGNDMYKIDQLINYIRNRKDEKTQDKQLVTLAVYLGTKLGDLLLDEKVLNAGYDWDRVKKYKYPCICNPQTELICNPISFLYSKLKYNSSAEDNSGTTSDFYYRFLELIEEKK